MLFHQLSAPYIVIDSASFSYCYRAESRENSHPPSRCLKREGKIPILTNEKAHQSKTGARFFYDAQIIFVPPNNLTSFKGVH